MVKLSARGNLLCLWEESTLLHLKLGPKEHIDGTAPRSPSPAIGEATIDS